MDEKLKILLCEDDENLGMLLREFLQAKGYSADLCPDGDKGYKAFLKGRYDLCVLDVMMPRKDGFTLAQEIRNVSSETPIIFLTARNMKEDVLQGFKLGADDYGGTRVSDQRHSPPREGEARQGRDSVPHRQIYLRYSEADAQYQ